MLKALIWDVDGTIAETERDGHRVAFNLALKEFGLRYRWDVHTYGRLLAVTGGYERLLHDMAHRGDAHVPRAAVDRERLARLVHRRKNELYAGLVQRGHLAARPGVLRLVQECEDAGLALAVATTTGRGNVQALFPRLFGERWPQRFAAVVCAEDAPQKKPDPQPYRLALQRLGLAPRQALAVEDSPNGLQAARAAGLPTLVTRSEYFRHADFDGADGVCDELDGPAVFGGSAVPRVDLAALRALHARAGRPLVH